MLWINKNCAKRLLRKTAYDNLASIVPEGKESHHANLQVALNTKGIRGFGGYDACLTDGLVDGLVDG